MESKGSNQSSAFRVRVRVRFGFGLGLGLGFGFGFGLRLRLGLEQPVERPRVEGYGVGVQQIGPGAADDSVAAPG